MTNRENALAVLHYGDPEKVPLVHFGFWPETVIKWADEGHVPRDVADTYRYQSEREGEVAKLLGFDFGWNTMVNGEAGLFPKFERKVLEILPDGRIKSQNRRGAIILEKPGVVSIPTEVGYTLVDRASWNELVEPRFRWTPERVDIVGIERAATMSCVPGSPEDRPRGMWCGSLYGLLRDMLGVENSAYLQVDDPDLYVEIIDRIGSLALTFVDATLDAAESRGFKFDYGHFWEDICFKNGPLVSPGPFSRYVGPWYRKISDRLARGGIDLISLDCDGMIDALLPIWIENGVNVMFPIEVGTWKASIAPWRKRYGKAVRGVGGVEKAVFSRDRAAVAAEIERLKPLVAAGGFLPCPDHRVPPDAEWDNVVYYCDLFRETFGF